tara:strand:- start:1133 stop:1492 length:360 start_codon:yes stop_codon:yes gene_type:complete
MEFEPVVEIIQVDGIPRVAIRQTIGRKDALTSVVVMDVAFDGIVKSLDGVTVKDSPGLFFDPSFELRISWLVVCDMRTNGFGVKTESSNNHGVIPGAYARIAFGNFASCLEGDFLPKAR